MTQVNALFCHCRLLEKVEIDVSLVFSDPHLNQTYSLSNVHLSILAGNGAYTWHFWDQVILADPKKTGQLPWPETHHLEGMFR
jgi:hypothetical protein